MSRKFLAGETTTRLGIGGATPDDNNRFAMNAPQALFNNAGAGVSLYINKAATANDAGFTFQTNFSTRALFGALGGDDFVLKVSPDGSAFYTGITIAAATGIAAFTLSPTAPTPSAGDNTSKVATTGFVAASFVTYAYAGANYATLASPTFTGTPTAPTQGRGDTSTRLATTAYVDRANTKPCFMAYGPIYNGSGAEIKWQTKYTDNSNNALNISTGRFTAPVAGYYSVSANALTQAVANTDVIAIAKNGTIVGSRGTYVGSYGGAALDYVHVSTTIIIYLSVGDYISVIGQSNLYNGNDGLSNFCGFLISTS